MATLQELPVHAPLTPDVQRPPAKADGPEWKM